MSPRVLSRVPVCQGVRPRPGPRGEEGRAWPRGCSARPPTALLGSHFGPESLFQGGREAGRIGQEARAASLAPRDPGQSRALFLCSVCSEELEGRLSWKSLTLRQRLGQQGPTQRQCLPGHGPRVQLHCGPCSLTCRSLWPCLQPQELPSCVGLWPWRGGEGLCSRPGPKPAAPRPA